MNRNTIPGLMEANRDATADSFRGASDQYGALFAHFGSLYNRVAMDFNFFRIDTCLGRLRQTSGVVRP